MSELSLPIGLQNLLDKLRHELEAEQAAHRDALALCSTYEARITELEAEVRYWRQQHAECTTSLITEVRKTEQLEMQLAQRWTPLPPEGRP